MNTSNFSRLTLGVLAFTMIAQSTVATVPAVIVPGVTLGAEAAAGLGARALTYLSTNVGPLVVGGLTTAGVATGAALTKAANYFNPTPAPSYFQSAKTAVSNCVSKGSSVVTSPAGKIAAVVVGSAAIGSAIIYGGYKMLGSSVKSDQQAQNPPIHNNWYRGVNQTTKDAFAKEVRSFVTSTSFSQDAANQLFQSSSRFGHNGLVNLVTTLIQQKKDCCQNGISKAALSKRTDSMNRTCAKINSLLQQ